jgi:predicted RNA-binding protein YlqC (UPF0109 family)
MRTLEEIFKEAVTDKDTVSLDGVGYEARMLYGIKISKDNYTQYVTIQECKSNSDYYVDICMRHYELFGEKGWKYALYVLSLNNLRLRLDEIGNKIRQEINSRNNEKYIKSLVQSKDNLETMYNKINNKLIKLN